MSEPQLELHLSDTMIQSGLSRLKLVFSGGGGGGGGGVGGGGGGGGDREMCRHHGPVSRSLSHHPRPGDLGRQMLSKV